MAAELEATQAPHKCRSTSLIPVYSSLQATDFRPDFATDGHDCSGRNCTWRGGDTVSKTNGTALDSRRVPHLPDGVLASELGNMRYQLSRLEQEIRNHRNNPSDQGAVVQMEQIARRDELRNYVGACHAEVEKRKTAGTFKPNSIPTAMVKKDNPPMPPVLKPVAPKSSPLGTSHDPDDKPEELPIVVFDGGFVPRAWRQSDGPIHDKGETITDVNQGGDKDS